MSKKRTKSSSRSRKKQRNADRHEDGMFLRDLEMLEYWHEEVAAAILAMVGGSLSDHHHLSVNGVTTCLRYGVDSDDDADIENMETLVELARVLADDSVGLVVLGTVTDKIDLESTEADHTQFVEEVRTWIFRDGTVMSLTGEAAASLAETGLTPERCVFVDAHPIMPAIAAALSNIDDGDGFEELSVGTREFDLVLSLIEHVEGTGRHIVTCDTIGSSAVHDEFDGTLTVEHLGLFTDILEVLDRGEPGSILLRSFMSEIDHRLPNGVGIPVKQVRGWQVLDGKFNPLPAADMFDAACTDSKTGGLLAPERGVEYVDAHVLDSFT